MTENGFSENLCECWSAPLVLDKGLSLTNIKINTVNTCLLCDILKIIIGNMLNSMKESPNFYPF